MSVVTYPVVRAATILQIMPAPGRLEDAHGNEYVGYALCEFDLEWEDGGRVTSRDILPFGPDGAIFTLSGYYELHAFGDDRPPYAHFVAPLSEAA